MRVFVLCAGIVISATAPALAQSKPARGFLSLNAGGSAPAAALSDRFEFRANVETATVAVRYPVRAAVMFEAGGGITLWRRLGIGIAVSRMTSGGAAEVTASIPHPFFFDRARTVEGEQRDITRAENAAHLQLLYSLPASGRWRVVLSAGPTFVSVERELVTDLQYDETYPFDEATFRAATTRRAKGSAVGANGAIDIRWMRGRHFGIGGLLRYSHAPADLDTVDNRRLRVKTGGLQAGAGLRIAF